MSVFKKRIIRVVIAMISVLFLLVLFAQLLARDAVSNFLIRKLPPHVQLKYNDIDVNVLTGSVGLNDIQLNIYNRDSLLVNTSVEIEALALSGLGYWDFLVQQKIAVDQLLMVRPKVRYHPYRVRSVPEKEREGVVQLLKTIVIDQFTLENGRLDILRQAADSTAVSVQRINFNIENVLTGPKQIRYKIPITYGNYELKLDSLFVELSKFEALRVGSVVWNQDVARVGKLNLFTKYSKQALSQHLLRERDHVDLWVPEMLLDSIRFGFKRDTFFIATGSGKIKAPKLVLYRDKLVTDSKIAKPLYSKSIREMPIHLDIPQIIVDNGEITYSEKVVELEDLGKLHFTKLDGVISNISNTYQPGEKTNIAAKANFMQKAKLSLDWSFDATQSDDRFIASGKVLNFDAGSINPYLESNARSQASGTINELYFTLNGNTSRATGHIKMKYEDFKFKVLKKDRTGINKVLTFIGNIFVNDGSKADAEGYRYGRIETERDSTTTFFSYLLQNVRSGALNTMTGKGNKK